MQNWGINILIIFLLIRCTPDYSGSQPEILIELKVDHPTDIELFYTENEAEKFTENKKIKLKITDTVQFHKLIFRPEMKGLPKQIRIDFGYDSLLTQVSLRKFEFKMI